MQSGSRAIRRATTKQDALRDQRARIRAQLADIGFIRRSTFRERFSKIEDGGRWVITLEWKDEE